MYVTKKPLDSTENVESSGFLYSVLCDFWGGSLRLLDVEKFMDLKAQTNVEFVF